MDKKIVGFKWLCNIKEGAGSNAKPRYEARLVARGLDFNEVLSPVVRHISIRILLAMTTKLNLNLEQIDVTTTFLHGELDERILMEQLKGFESKGKVEQVCLLKKSLYGLEQSPRQWYKKFDTFMLSQGFARSSYDCCVYFKHVSNSISIYLPIIC